jgi:hypothetical protein
VTLRCTDCAPRKNKRGRPRRITHVPKSFYCVPVGKPVRDGGWNGAAWCAEHGPAHEDAVLYDAAKARRHWEKT